MLKSERITPYRKASRGDSDSETGVPGNINDGDVSLEWSKECECESGGVWSLLPSVMIS